MLNPLDEVVRHQKAGEAFGVTSICWAHLLVLEAAMLQASDDGGHVLVVATSNQVDQIGGYTGMRHKDVIGTDVPVPGGAHGAIGDLVPTSPEAARTTLKRHREEFAEQGLDDVWPRVMASVVRPGVEFDHLHVIDDARERTTDLQQVLDDEPNMVFEARSTDYQTVASLTALVEDHRAVLKVGPGLTCARRCSR